MCHAQFEILFRFSFKVKEGDGNASEPSGRRVSQSLKQANGRNDETHDTRECFHKRSTRKDVGQNHGTHTGTESDQPTMSEPVTQSCAWIWYSLQQENDELRAKEKKHKQIIEILEENEKELAKKNLSNQKVSVGCNGNCWKRSRRRLATLLFGFNHAQIIRMLTEKCKDYELSLQEYEARYDNEDPSLEGEVEILRAQTETQR